MEVGVLPTRNGGQKNLHAQEPHRALLGITTLFSCFHMALALMTQLVTSSTLIPHIIYFGFVVVPDASTVMDEALHLLFPNP